MIRILPPTVRGFVPWMEMNNGDARMEKLFDLLPHGAERGMLFKEFCRRGLVSWTPTTGYVLITTRCQQVPVLYDWLMEHKPAGMTIVGGLKTSSVLPSDDFCSESDWNAIAEAAKEIVERTGVNECTLNNEGSLQRFHNGEENIDPNRLRRAMAPLRESGIPFIFYFPRPFDNKPSAPNRHNATRDLMFQIAELVPLAEFMCNGEATPDYVHSPRARNAQTIMTATLGPERLVYRFLVAPVAQSVDKGWYSPAKVLPAMEAVQYSERSLWTGARDWVKVAEEIAAGA